MRIQLIDQEGRSMFKENSREPNDRAKILLRAIAKIINQLPNRITVSGHTSSNALGRKSDSDWSLSAGRADASRIVLRNAGVADDRIYQVSGKANSEPLYADDPTLAGNRRISIVLLREKPVLPDGL
jgi:chemotaxis protein MotB